MRFIKDDIFANNKEPTRLLVGLGLFAPGFVKPIKPVDLIAQVMTKMELSTYLSLRLLIDNLGTTITSDSFIFSLPAGENLNKLKITGITVVGYNVHRPESLLSSLIKYAGKNYKEPVLKSPVIGITHGMVNTKEWLDLFRNIEYLMSHKEIVIVNNNEDIINELKTHYKVLAS